MSLQDFFRIPEIKEERDNALKELAALKTTMTELGGMDYHQVKAALAVQEQNHSKWLAAIQQLDGAYKDKKAALEKQIQDLNAQIEERKKDVIILDDEILLQSFGFYKPKYDLQNSQEYKARLDAIRLKQETMIKNGTAVAGSQTWTVNNDRKAGERMVKDYMKLTLRSFDNECDASIMNVKFNNIESIEKKIQKAYDTLNKLNERMSISITAAYLKLKMEELHLCYEYAIKKQEEKEEQKRLREQMREEARVQKEIDDEKNKIEKEERHFRKALALINERLAQAQTESEQAMLNDEKAKLEKNLADVEKDKLDVFNREKNTRAGYVYIISNVGSFGENIYKIGVTRRFDPTERVDELSDASVPFDFDIHATIFSDDAPALEFALHKAFAHRRLNMINYRREFFNVSLDEIEDVVRKNFKKPVEIVRLADAAEYRQSLLIKGSAQ